MNAISSNSTVQRLLHSRNFLGLVVLVAIGAVFGWEFWQASQAKKETWEGKIVETYRTRRWWRGFMKPMETQSYRYYNHYWRITLTGGAVVSVKVPWSSWDDAKPGDPVRKRFGQRYPELATPQADAQRQARDEALGQLLR